MTKRQVIVLIVLGCTFQSLAYEATQRHHTRSLRRNGKIRDEEKRHGGSQLNHSGGSDGYEYYDRSSIEYQKRKPENDPRRPCNSKFLYGCSERPEHGKSGKGPDRPCFSEQWCNHYDSWHHDGHQSNGERPHHGKSGKGSGRPCNSKFLYGCNQRPDSWYQKGSDDENDEIHVSYHHNGKESDVPSVSSQGKHHCRGLQVMH
ncbi:hypothetical protein HJC23_009129 [Cyclotella cryptica]|uniref:Secreted protein n=1 Tax=Cyclotella cryptica TaxID=29204 RepID=A0ABD3NZE0_9STRA|eukprot:CCRYP_018750-RA/>CCRYP_018750-RA protein AED:0.19 eAED:0.19 QI:0/-1/0/1/-1/1/1/0/202